MLVIPAIDLLGGRVVRLLRGEYDQVTTYDRDPAEQVAAFAAAGADRVHVVDLDAARGQGQNRGAIRALASGASVDIEVGGGVRRAADVEDLLAAGAGFVVVGTAAVEDPAEVAGWAARWPGRVYVGVDARDGIVATHGWERETALTVAELLDRYGEAPVAGFIYTDIGRDGALMGAAIESLREVIHHAAHPVILSGGVTVPADVSAARDAGAAGVIVGRAIYEGRLTVEAAVGAARPA